VASRLDYVTWYQDLVTSSPTSDVEVFRVAGEGLFLVTMNYNWREPARKQQCTVFKWQQGYFTVYQSLYILAAHKATYFTIKQRVSITYLLTYLLTDITILFILFNNSRVIHA